MAGRRDSARPGRPAPRRDADDRAPRGDRREAPRRPDRDEPGRNPRPERAGGAAGTRGRADRPAGGRTGGDWKDRSGRPERAPQAGGDRARGSSWRDRRPTDDRSGARPHAAARPQFDQPPAARPARRSPTGPTPVSSTRPSAPPCAASTPATPSGWRGTSSPRAASSTRTRARARPRPGRPRPRVPRRRRPRGRRRRGVPRRRLRRGRARAARLPADERRPGLPRRARRLRARARAAPRSRCGWSPRRSPSAPTPRRPPSCAWSRPAPAATWARTRRPGWCWRRALGGRPDPAGLDAADAGAAPVGGRLRRPARAPRATDELADGWLAAIAAADPETSRAVERSDRVRRRDEDEDRRGRPRRAGGPDDVDAEPRTTATDVEPTPRRARPGEPRTSTRRSRPRSPSCWARPTTRRPGQEDEPPSTERLTDHRRRRPQPRRPSTDAARAWAAVAPAATGSAA